MASITKIHTIKAPFEHEQSDIIDFMQQRYQFDAIELRKVKWVYRKSGIETRYSVLPDFTSQNKPVLFRSGEAEVGISERLNVYNHEGFELSKALLNQFEDLTDITHLITISCTGIAAPGLELKLLQWLNSNASQRSINFMGCYAAIHGMKQAQEICALQPTAKVLLVDIELCTLHFQYSTKPDLVNSAMIFGDGAAAWIVEGNSRNGLEIIGTFNKVLHKENDKMAWYPSETGFLMQLSSYIPDIIGDNIKSLINDALTHYKVKNINDVSLCIHPGGLKILDKIAEAMNLEKGTMASSYEILSEYGNMSSPTVVYVLQRMMKANRVAIGDKVLMIAFGPGLSIETCLLQLN